MMDTSEILISEKINNNINNFNNFNNFNNINRVIDDIFVSVKVLPGIGDILANKLAKLNIFSVLDLLLHIPYSFQDRTRIVNIRDIRDIYINKYIVIEGQVVDYRISYTRNKKRSLILYLQDFTDVIELRFFHFNNAQLQQFANKPRLRCFGEVKYGMNTFCMMHPEYQVIENINININSFENRVETNLTPIYPSTEGISQKRWLQIINKGLVYLDKLYNSGSRINLEFLPKELTEKYNLMSFIDAIKFIHQPSPDISVDILNNKEHPAQYRLIFEELLANQLAMQLLKQQQNNYQAPSLNNQEYWSKLLKILPFELTSAQDRVVNEISKDLKNSSVPMCRLLQGDVGSGKTIVAALASLQAVGSGYQVAMMVPTEILAQQHYDNLNKYFSELNIKVDLLISKIKNSTKEQLKSDLASGKTQVIIGTHALIQSDVRFFNLGLIIIDEQHRFGVEQRMLLWQKGINNNIAPHQLAMTATPIPRTLAMTLYADMDYSVIDELPKGREAIKTVMVSDTRKQEVIDRIIALCQQGRQVYWVCTLIEASETLLSEAAIVAYEYLYQYLKDNLPGLKVGLIHGRLKSNEKKLIMDDFKNNKINILVATTVIEVGVDVPNASLMVIENPERLGLSQLHQLRGRVGRGSHESYCVLLYKSPLGQVAKSRLEIMKTCSDGFILAEYDLKFRGAGEILGKRQTGIWQLKVADLIKNRSMLQDIKNASLYIVKKHPNLVMFLIKLWLGEKYKLGSIL